MLSRSRTTSVATPSHIKSAELSAVVTVGEESAELLSKKLGREVKAGEQFDLGVIAATHKNPLVRLWWFFVKKPAPAANLFN